MSLVGKKYSRALMEVAENESNIDQVYEQFKSVVDILDENKPLWDILVSPTTETIEKKSILENIFKASINGYLYNFMMVVTDKNRIVDLKDIFKEFRDIYFEKKNMVEATIVTAVEIDENLLSKLKDNFEKKYNKTVMVKPEVDPDIIGGLVVYVGDHVIDGSIKRKLSMLRNELKEIKLQELGVN